MDPGDRLRHQTVVERFDSLGRDRLIVAGELLLAVKPSLVIGLGLIVG